MTPTHPHDEIAERRRRVRRTAWTIVAVVVAVYLAFILSGVLASGVLAA